jgi:hypothetical protein
MKNKKLKELIERNTTIDVMARSVRINILNEYCEISAYFKGENNFDLYVDGLTEYQENIVISHMKDLYNFNFSDRFDSSIVTQEDRLHAESLLYR